MNDKAASRYAEALEQKQKIINQKELDALQHAIDQQGATVRDDGVIVWELSEREKELVKSLNE